jgi:hypothetical protein
MAALAQNGDGLGADQAGAADDDNLHGYLLSMPGEPSEGLECKGGMISEPQRA